MKIQKSIAIILGTFFLLMENSAAKELTYKIAAKIDTLSIYEPFRPEIYFEELQIGSNIMNIGEIITGKFTYNNALAIESEWDYGSYKEISYRPSTSSPMTGTLSSERAGHLVSATATIITMGDDVPFGSRGDNLFLSFSNSPYGFAIYLKDGNSSIFDGQTLLPLRLLKENFDSLSFSYSFFDHHPTPTSPAGTMYLAKGGISFFEDITSSVPEPKSHFMLLSGIIGILAITLRRRRHSSRNAIQEPAEVGKVLSRAI